jgi:hypothetical protein
MFPALDLHARRLSVRQVLSVVAHVPEKACPALDAGWTPVFRKGHAPTQEIKAHPDPIYSIGMSFNSP